MINIQFNLNNPFVKKIHKQIDYYEKIWNITKYKNIEAQISSFKMGMIITGGLRISFKEDHAGIYFCFGIFGIEVMIDFYDSRHWNDKENRWEIYPDDNSI